MIQFGRDDNREQSGSVFDPRRKPPPNYFSRAVQLKILVMVFLFLGVLMLMSEARNPKNWRWMWQFDGKPAPTPGSETSGDVQTLAAANASASAPRRTKIDTRPPRIAARDASPRMPLVTSADQTTLLPSSTSNDGAKSPREATTTVQRDGWAHVLRRLDKQQRELLYQGMWSWRHQRKLSGEQKRRWSKLVDRIDAIWTNYHTQALVSIARDGDHLTDVQKRASLEILEASKRLWQSQETALQALGLAEHLAQQQTQTLTRLQQVWDDNAWAQVQDNSVLRGVETEAWDRSWERLRSLSPQELAQAVGPLNFVQLFAQSSVYRGRLVKICSTLRWAYRSAPRTPRYGIDTYYVLGLLPADHSDSPIVVYCVDLPDGFPAIAPADEKGRGKPLDEDVEITGYYFKRWLHRCEDGMNLSPLILGRITHWEPRARQALGDQRGSITGTILLAATLGMAILATLIAFWVYRSSHWSSSEVTPVTQTPASLPSFDAGDVRGNVTETLSRLGEQGKANEQPD